LTSIANGRRYTKSASSNIPTTSRGIVTYTTYDDRAKSKASGCAIAYTVADAAADETENRLG
jgi:hypothetical protein